MAQKDFIGDYAIVDIEREIDLRDDYEVTEDAIKEFLSDRYVVSLADLTGHCKGVVVIEHNQYLYDDQYKSYSIEDLGDLYIDKHSWDGMYSAFDLFDFLPDDWKDEVEGMMLDDGKCVVDCDEEGNPVPLPCRVYEIFEGLVIVPNKWD